jgi:hypothetical protein
VNYKDPITSKLWVVKKKDEVVAHTPLSPTMVFFIFSIR